jgi:hypothetical protein
MVATAAIEARLEPPDGTQVKRFCELSARQTHGLLLFSQFNDN